MLEPQLNRQIEAQSRAFVGTLTSNIGRLVHLMMPQTDEGGGEEADKVAPLVDAASALTMSGPDTATPVTASSSSMVSRGVIRMAGSEVGGGASMRQRTGTTNGQLPALAAREVSTAERRVGLCSRPGGAEVWVDRPRPSAGRPAHLQRVAHHVAVCPLATAPSGHSAHRRPKTKGVGRFQRTA